MRLLARGAPRHGSACERQARRIALAPPLHVKAYLSCFTFSALLFLSQSISALPLLPFNYKMGNRFSRQTEGPAEFSAEWIENLYAARAAITTADTDGDEAGGGESC